MNYKQIIPCDGWFYAGDSEGVGDVLIRVAAWALTDEGRVIGLIPGRDDPKDRLGTPVLEEPSDFPGTYIYYDNLTLEQQLITKLPINSYA